VNGSGKHDNWSVSADGVNLLEPSDEPEENLQFLVFLSFLVAAVDEHADLLRASVASAGNDHRLGANEAPPAIVSVYLGDALTPVVDALVNDRSIHSHAATEMDLGVPMLPNVFRDNTDRNRTSPFAFTGNKFEFRMCGSQQNISDANVVLNTAVAEQCDRFANALDRVPADKFVEHALAWVKKTLREHKRVIFEGNGYAGEWEEEAARRGLPNLKSTPDALPCMVLPQNIELFERYGVMSESEVRARYVAAAEQYGKLINIEANTMAWMARRLYLPALTSFSGEIATSVAAKAEIGIASPMEKETVSQLTQGITSIADATHELERRSTAATQIADPMERDVYYHDEVIPAMDVLREAVDVMEGICAEDFWPVPSYNKLLFWV
jgi:glutamine synthetase